MRFVHYSWKKEPSSSSAVIGLAKFVYLPFFPGVKLSAWEAAVVTDVCLLCF